MLIINLLLLLIIDINIHVHVHNDNIMSFDLKNKIVSQYITNIVMHGDECKTYYV